MQTKLKLLTHVESSEKHFLAFRTRAVDDYGEI